MLKRQRSATGAGNGAGVSLGLLGGAAAGAGLMYLFDPERGRRRRGLLRDKAIHVRHVGRDAASIALRDLSNRSRGLVSGLGARLRGEHVDDEQLEERVRARLGHVTRRASAIDVSANDGRVRLSGPALAAEAADIAGAVRRVRGVRAVDDRMVRHASPEDEPALAPIEPNGSSGNRLRPANWSPATRLAAGSAGGALALAGARRGDAAGAAMAVAGGSLLATSLVPSRF